MATPASSTDKRTSLEDKMLTTRTPDEETEDGRIRNREAATKIRDAWIYKQIRARQDEFTQYRTVSIIQSDCCVNTAVSRCADGRCASNMYMTCI
jgi:hypothetical protein